MLVGVCSMKGSPGVTTIAMAIAAAWPQSTAVVMELDCGGGDLALLQGLRGDRGLLSLAAAARRDSPDAVDVLEHCQPLGGGGIRVLVGPPGAEQARGAIGLLASRSSLLKQPVRRDRDCGLVVADFGRLEPGSPAWPLVSAVDVLVIMTGGRACDLAHLFARTPALAEATAAVPHTGLGLREPCRYDQREMEETMGMPVMMHLPHDPVAAAALLGEPAKLVGSASWRLSRGPLARRARQFVGTLREVMPSDVVRSSPWIES